MHIEYGCSNVVCYHWPGIVPPDWGWGGARLRMWMKFIRFEKFQKITRFTRIHSKITPINNCGERKYSFGPRCLQDTQGTLGMQLLWSFHPSGAGIWWCNHPGVTHAPWSYLSTHSLLYVNTGYSLVHQARLWLSHYVVCGGGSLSELNRCFFMTPLETHTTSSNVDGWWDCRGCT